MLGSLTLGIPVNANDSEQDVLDKITAALNANTVTDLYNTSTLFSALIRIDLNTLITSIKMLKKIHRRQNPLSEIRI